MHHKYGTCGTTGTASLKNTVLQNEAQPLLISLVDQVVNAKNGYKMQRKNTLVTFLIVCVITILTGCAGLPSPEVMKAEAATYQLPKLPEAGKAIVYVVRPDGDDGHIRFNIFVDNQEASSEMGYTRGIQYIYFNLLPGEHNIYSKAENWAEVAVSAKAGDIIFLQQEATWGFIIARNNLFKIEDYQGKYHVKRLEYIKRVGTIIKSDK